MAVKKSDLYSSLWASCNELRGGMDSTQYKDYVLFMLFIKYVSDKYANSDDMEPPIVIPEGASFDDMVALTGNPQIGELINTQVIQPLVEANERLARTDFFFAMLEGRSPRTSAFVAGVWDLFGIAVCAGIALRDLVVHDRFEFFVCDHAV